jgi:hypothetical protein
MNISITTNGRLMFGDRVLPLTVKQEQSGTRLYNANTGEKIALPHNRYSLSGDNPPNAHNGVQGRSQFERDVMALLEK